MVVRIINFQELIFPLIDYFSFDNESKAKGVINGQIKILKNLKTMKKIINILKCAIEENGIKNFIDNIFIAF